MWLFQFSLAFFGMFFLSRQKLQVAICLFLCWRGKSLFTHSHKESQGGMQEWVQCSTERVRLEELTFSQGNGAALRIHLLKTRALAYTETSYTVSFLAFFTETTRLCSRGLSTCVYSFFPHSRFWFVCKFWTLCQNLWLALGWRSVGAVPLFSPQLSFS